MYNSFIFNFEEQLNDSFLEFKTEGITDLVLDLRYNSGGRGTSATILASLISGLSTNDLFFREIFNSELQEQFEANNPGALENNFTNQTLDGTPLNKLNLPRVIILTTNNSASASELVINGLEPYLDVVQIGETTSGKYQGSLTLYDSPGLTDSEGANPDHTIAIQPLISQVANADGVTDYAAGLFPDMFYTEIARVFNGEDLGQIGDPNEAFLNVALEYISTGNIPSSIASKNLLGKKINWEAKASSPTYQRMYMDLEKHKGIFRRTY